MVTITRGYHATSRKYARSISGPEDFIIKEFREETLLIGDKSKPSPMPGDLGIGVYFFVDIGNQLNNPKKMASKYYMKYKHHTYNERAQIIEADLNISDFYELDLNTHEVRNEYHAFIEKYKDKIYRIYDENIKDSNSKSRGVISGLIIEMMIRDLIKRKNISIDYVTQDTVTQLDGFIQTIPNCTEMCVRNKAMIINVS